MTRSTWKRLSIPAAGLPGLAAAWILMSPPESIQPLRAAAAPVRLRDEEPPVPAAPPAPSTARPPVRREAAELPRRRLERLAQQATEDSIGEVLKALEDPAFDLPHRAEFFEELLMPHEDPRIYPAALRVLQDNLSAGKDSWYDTEGYIRLVAAKGGCEGAEWLWAAIRGGNDQIAGASAEALGLAKDRSLAPWFLDLVGRRPVADRELVRALAGWRDPAVSHQLLQMAGSRPRQPEPREAALEAIGQNAPADQIDHLFPGLAD